MIGYMGESSRERPSHTDPDARAKESNGSVPLPKRVIVWKTAGEKPYFASLRYRCLIQIPHFKALGWTSLVLFKKEKVRDWSRVAALVLVKSCRNNDVALAREATRAGVPVIYDLTDNFFAEGYGGSGIERLRDNIRTLSGFCRAITVASPAMVQMIRPHLQPGIPVHVVPDPVESELDTQAAYGCRAWRRDFLNLRRCPPLRAVKRFGHGLGDLLKGDLRAIRHRLPPAPIPLRSEGRKRIVWFGSSGKHKLSGLTALADIIPDLERLNRQVPIELLVVSNSQRRFRNEISVAGFPTIFRPWHPFGVFRCIQSADAVVIPNRNNAFSLPKSANRAILALSLGVPVVATMLPALAHLSAALYEEDWAASLKEIFLQRDDAEQRVALGNAIIEREFSGPAVAAKWQEVLDSVLSERATRASLPQRLVRPEPIQELDEGPAEQLRAASQG